MASLKTPNSRRAKILNRSLLTVNEYLKFEAQQRSWRILEMPYNYFSQKPIALLNASATFLAISTSFSSISTSDP